MDHHELIDAGAKWLKTTRRSFYRCTVVLKEFNTHLPEVPDVLGFNHVHSVLIECKASRADFFADQKKPHRGYRGQLGQFRLYLSMPDIIRVGDLPESWGLLHVHPNGLYLVKEPTQNPAPDVRATEWSILYSIIRRMQIRGLLKRLDGPAPEGTWGA